MSKARVFSTIILFLGFSALLLFGGQLAASDDSSPNARPEAFIPAAYQAPPSSGLGEISIMTNVNKYFTPQDENTSCTVMFIANPTATDAKVTITGYGLTGATTLTTTFTVPKKNMVRICSDTVTTISATWQNVLLINFTTSVTYAKITYPSTLKITAYVAWNTSGIYDPLESIPTLPITLY